MASSRSEINLHFVWSTHRRIPLVTHAIERAVYACIEQECRRLNCDVLAVGGTSDHVHLAVWIPTSIAPSALMQRVKGVSSAHGRTQLVTPGEAFAWQAGYGVFSFSRRDRDRVIAYVRDQKRRHAAGALWDPLEPSDLSD